MASHHALHAQSMAELMDADGSVRAIKVRWTAANEVEYGDNMYREFARFTDADMGDRAKHGRDVLTCAFCPEARGALPKTPLEIKLPSPLGRELYPAPIIWISRRGIREHWHDDANADTHDGTPAPNSQSKENSHCCRRKVPPKPPNVSDVVEDDEEDGACAKGRGNEEQEHGNSDMSTSEESDDEDGSEDGVEDGVEEVDGEVAEDVVIEVDAIAEMPVGKEGFCDL